MSDEQPEILDEVFENLPEVFEDLRAAVVQLGMALAESLGPVVPLMERLISALNDWVARGGLV